MYSWNRLRAMFVELAVPLALVYITERHCFGVPLLIVALIFAWTVAAGRR
jgi:hypothetical protein